MQERDGHEVYEHVTDWYAAPLVGISEPMLDSLLFRVRLKETDLARPGGGADAAAAAGAGGGLSEWPPVSSLVLRVVCEGYDDPNAATALFEARQASAAAPGGGLGGLGATVGGGAIAAFGPPADAPLRVIGQARTRIDRIASAAHAVTQSVLQDKHDGISTMLCTVHAALLSCQVVASRGATEAAPRPTPGSIGIHANMPSVMHDGVGANGAGANGGGANGGGGGRDAAAEGAPGHPTGAVPPPRDVATVASDPRARAADPRAAPVDPRAK